MVLAKFNHTAGNIRKFYVDYSEWKPHGVNTVSAVMSISGTTTATLSGTAVDPEGRVIFFVHGGTAGDTFTVNVATTFSNTEVKNDTISFTVIAP